MKIQTISFIIYLLAGTSISAQKDGLNASLCKNSNFQFTYTIYLLIINNSELCFIVLVKNRRELDHEVHAVRLALLAFLDVLNFTYSQPI